MKYFAEIEVDIEEIDKIMDRLAKAKEEIYDCYSKLSELGVIRFVKKEYPASAEH